MPAPSITVPLVPDAVRQGPGVLLTAPLGSTEPVGLTAAWDVAWKSAGPTIEGSGYTHTPSFESIRFAEFEAPVGTVNTGSEDQVTFNLGLVTALNLKLAFSGGTATTTTGLTKFEPPASAGTTRIMIGWQSDDGLERIVWRRCFQTGAVTLNRRRGAEVASLPMQFNVEEPGGGKTLFVRYASDTMDA